MAIAIRIAQIFVQFQKAEIGTEELYGIVTDPILENTTEAAN